jgi:ABC-2 type transport system ATP-binding protein
MIEIAGITKRFGAKTAVNGLNLTVPKGEFFAFLGPNGAGKTTTIKIMIGLLRADEGTVRLCGHDILADPVAAKSRVSYVPDEPYLYEKLSGREFLEFVGRMYRLDPARRERRIAELTEQLSLGDFIDDLAEGYSHGMKQRVVIAGALLHEPEVLVVDEPMVGLDPKSVRVVKDILCVLSKKGATVFMSTHTLAVAEEVADRIGIIHHGNMVALGTLEDLRRAAGGEAGLEDSFLRITADEETAQ